MNKNFILQSKKILILILIISVVTPSVFFYKPQKAEAIFGIGSDEAQIALWVKDYILDPLAYAFVNALTAQMTRDAVNWINGNNYKGPGGGTVPGFVTNQQSFLEKVGDRALGDFIQQKVPLLCGPFQADIRGYLKIKYDSNAYLDKNYCTWTGTKENVQQAYDNFTQNFNNGGWERWVNMTVSPINNSYGAVVSADARAGAYIRGAKGSMGDELNWGKGFLSWKKETGKCEEFAKVSLYDKNGNPFPDTGNLIKGHWVNPYTDEDLGPVFGNPPCIGEDTRKEKIETPGSFLEKGLSDAIGLSGDRLTLGDEIDEIIGALIARLVGLGFDAVGLGAADTSGEEGNINNAKQRIKTTIDNMTANTQEYINIKKASLELIGKFDLVGVQLGTAGQINQKINWAGNDFEWTTGRYYKEDRSSKIDWTGEPFRWKNGIHYDEKNTKTGVIPIIGCAPLKDTSLPASYVTTESFTSPFWGKSECLNIKNASGQHIKYEWGTTTPIAKENSVVKAISASCGQNNIGATGYVVIADEIDGLWNSSLCEKIATTTVDWSKTTTTDKKIYNLKSTRYIERMVDWSGLLFNWEESKVYDSRNLYRFPMEMIQNFGHESYVGAELRGGNSFPVMIEPLSTPPKLCFPAERKANPRGQVVYGVKKGQNKGYERWTILECTKSPGDPVSETRLANFVNRPGDQEDYGAWKKLNETPIARIKIVLEGDIFNNLTENYGNVEVSTMFASTTECFTTKYGATSTKVTEINTQIEKRKTQRLQIISDILLAEKMIEDVKFLENSFNNLGVNGLFDYIYFMEQLNKVGDVIGISDYQVSQANDEKRKIESENATIKLKLNMCIGGENYVETEEDYFLGYSETEQSGYDEGYADGRAGNNNKPEPGERLPNGEPTKKGYENGRKDGRYFGYIHGYSVGEYEEANPNG